MRPRLLFFAALLITLGVCCCNRGGSGSGASSVSIVYIPKSTGNTYFDEVTRGFQDAAKETNAKFSTVGPSSSDATSQIPILKEQIQQGVDVIAISPNSPDALDQVLDEAKSHGITVITVDADLVGNESHRDAAVLPANFDEVGKSEIELLGSLIGYSGDFAILSSTTDAPNQNAWIATMKETLKNPKYAKMRLVDIVYGDDEAQKSTTECEGLLAKYPNLRGIIAPTSVGLAAAAVVVERAGVYPGGPHAVGKGLQLTGLSTPNQLKRAVKSGVVTKFQLWAPYNEGYIAAFLGEQIHGKKLTPTPGAPFTAGKLGPETFSTKLEVVAGPLITFDKSNIDQYSF